MHKPRGRGQPIIAFAVILGGWILLRLVIIGADLGARPDVSGTEVLARHSPESRSRKDVGIEQPRATPPALRKEGAKPHAEGSGALGGRRFAKMHGPVLPNSMPLPGVASQYAAVANPPGRTVEAQPVAELKLALGIDAPPAAHEVADAAASRWSADGWVLVRPSGGVVLANGIAPASYGASQVGAVLRYRLGAAAGTRPAVYVRASAAVGPRHEREIAAGVSLRPIIRVPVRVGSEVRLIDTGERSRVRPAIVAITELPPLGLPLGWRGEVYGQAGYVGGEAATAFADGQIRADRGVARIAGSELRIGGGLWGGAQRGAARLDAGPSATLGLALGTQTNARLALDWRVRLAGDAAPGSGPALTLSAGF
jgi:hypothetical protein